MKILFTEHAWEDYLYWQKSNQNNLSRVNELIKAIIREPFRGIGKPEPLKGNLSGYWSRRIQGEHRLVYRVQGKGELKELRIIQVRFHY